MEREITHLAKGTAVREQQETGNFPVGYREPKMWDEPENIGGKVKGLWAPLMSLQGSFLFSIVLYLRNIGSLLRFFQQYELNICLKAKLFALRRRN